MPGLPVIEPFLKTVFTRADVETQRLERLRIPGAMWSVITEDSQAFILTTALPGPDDPPAVVLPDPTVPLLLQTPAIQGQGKPSTSTALRAFGVDSLTPVTQAGLTKVCAVLSSAPTFWGRYVYAPGRVNSSGKVDGGHYSAAENQLFQGAGMRMLPIARQTGHVGLDANVAARDAAANVSALFEAVAPATLAATAPETLVFLDCESGVGQPSLSPGYYVSWAATLVQRGLEASGGTVRLSPAVYASRSDVKTWTALEAATRDGAPCAGAWVAAWLARPAPVAWSDALTTPQRKLPVPVLCWQYSNAGPGVDTNSINPGLVDEVIERLPAPS